ncbi:MAG: nicotinamide-nucleotide amidohydrolase family protein [Microbacteriaceae bacterium]|nr:nicotinamide-nucleotide amidohydrolase family protein [Microbacteriaceae bacterium]
MACEAVWLAATAGVRVAVAESLTGGALASAIVGVPGASAVFVGGVVAYDTEVKQQLLGVDGDLLAEGGPVQAEVARQMACDVRAALGVAADIGLATTGVAGPDPDLQTGQLPGTVFVGLVSSVSSRAVRLPVLAGDRAFIRAAAVNAALRLLIAEFAV